MPETIEVKVPDIGDFKDVPVIEVLVKAGDRVNAEDSLITVESDKATMEVPSPAEGVIKELRVKVGDKVSEGTLVLLLEPAADKAGAAGEPASEPPAGEKTQSRSGESEGRETQDAGSGDRNAER